MDFFLAYAPKGTSNFVKSRKGKKPKEGSFQTDEEKISFLEKLQPGDYLYTEMFGGNDKFCYAAHIKSVNVWRITANEFKQIAVIPEDRAQRARLLRHIALNNPNKFYPVSEIDIHIIKLRILIDAYEGIQQSIRIPIQLRLGAIHRDLALIPSSVFQTTLREQFAPQHIFQVALDFEASLKAEIKNTLKYIPVWQLFEKINGCGPLIGARLIARIGDIRRFKTAGNLKSYAGFGFTKDRQCVSREYGENNKIGSPALKQAFWLFLDQVNRHDPTKDPWKTRLLARKLYEREKHPEPIKSGKTTRKGEIVWLYTDGHIHNRAGRHVIQKFIEWLWAEWREFEGITVNSSSLNTSELGSSCKT